MVEELVLPSETWLAQRVRESQQVPRSPGVSRGAGVLPWSRSSPCCRCVWRCTTNEQGSILRVLQNYASCSLPLQVVLP
jgi:hypothetical protein